MEEAMDQDEDAAPNPNGTDKQLIQAIELIRDTEMESHELFMGFADATDDHRVNGLILEIAREKRDQLLKLNMLLRRIDSD